MNSIFQFEHYFESLEAAKASKIPNAQWLTYESFRGEAAYALDGEDFFEDLITARTLQERVQCIRTTDYDLSLEPRPEMLVCAFDYLVKTPSDAMLVAIALKKRLGTIAICRAESLKMRRPICLLDIVELDEEHGNVNVAKLLGDAMRLLEFKLWADVPMPVIVDSFCLDVKYACYLPVMWKYSYLAICLENEWKEREINEYLFNPCRVGKWLERHPDGDLENYIQ